MLTFLSHSYDSPWGFWYMHTMDKQFQTKLFNPHSKLGLLAKCTNSQLFK